MITSITSEGDNYKPIYWRLLPQQQNLECLCARRL